MEELTLENDPKYEAWRQANPEWRTMFPILEMGMNDHCLKISLANEKACLKVALPKQVVEALFAKWQEFQNGTATENPTIWRKYTGKWDKEKTLFPWD